MEKEKTLTLYLPLKYKEEKATANYPAKENYPAQHLRTNLIDTAELIMDDDRHSIVAEDKVLLVIEDDIRFTKILIDKAHDFGLKVVIAISYLKIFEIVLKYNP